MAEEKGKRLQRVVGGGGEQAPGGAGAKGYRQ